MADRACVHGSIIPTASSTRSNTQQGKQGYSLPHTHTPLLQTLYSCTGCLIQIQENKQVHQPPAHSQLQSHTHTHTHTLSLTSSQTHILIFTNPPPHHYCLTQSNLFTHKHPHTHNFILIHSHTHTLHPTSLLN